MFEPRLPKQKNYYDCGIFALAYAEFFLHDPSFILKKIKSPCKKIKLFSRQLIDLRRENLEFIIQNIIIARTTGIEVNEAIKRVASKYVEVRKGFIGNHILLSD